MPIPLSQNSAGVAAFVVRFWVFLILAFFHQSGFAQIANFNGYCQSVSLQPATASNGAQIIFSTANGNNTPFYDRDTFGNLIISDELRPRSGQPTVFEAGYAAVFFNQIEEYGVVTANIPFADQDGNGFTDFAQLDRSVDLIVSGTANAFWQTPYSAPISIHLTRNAGNVRGNYSAVANLPTGILSYSGEFDVGAATGALNYDRANLTVNIQGTVTTRPGRLLSCSGSGTYSIQNGNIVLSAIPIVTSDGVYQGLPTVLTRVPGTSKFRGNLQFADGDIFTSWPDYVNWMLEVQDLNDVNGNGIPDIVDAPIAPPNITSQPVGTNVFTGHPFTLSVSATGSAPITYQWVKDNKPMAPTSANTYTVNSATLSDAGLYYVVVSNSVNHVISGTVSVGVTVQTSAPSIVQQPVGTNVVVGSAVILSVIATGTSPLNYQWSFNGKASSWTTNPSLVFQNIPLSASGTYFVTVSNSVGTATSQSVDVLVTPVAVSGVFLEILHNRGAIQILAHGTNGVPYSLDSSTNLQTWTSFQQFTMGSAPSSIPIVLNSKGAQFFRLTQGAVVNTLPVITKQPQSILISIGTSATFTVVATGTGPLTYQWQKNENPIPNATNSVYTIAVTRKTDAASYTVVVSNPFGSVTSDPALLKY